MSVTRFRFQPPWWSWFALVLTATILAGLGTWQLQRAQAKEQILAQREVAGKAEAANLAAASDPQALYGHAVAASGAYTQRQILLDNQVWQGRVGYRVWTPLVLDDGRLVLVDRGWVGGAGNRQRLPQPPVPAGSLEIRGYWRALPQPGLRLGAPRACNQGDWPRRLNYPTYEQIACQYQAPVVNGLLLLDESLGGGFPRDWGNLGMRPIRHIGYAVQWYAMAVAVLVLFVVVNCKRKA